MFVCNNIKISNVQYHFHVSDKNALAKNTQSRPKIRIFSREQTPDTKNYVSTLPSPRIAENRDQEPSLLEKIKKKNQSLTTTLFCTQTRNRDHCVSTVKDYHIDPYCSRKRLNTKDSKMAEKNLFLKGKTFVTHEFEEIYSEDEGSSLSKERKVRVEESDIIQRNLNGRFKQISRQLVLGEFTQFLAVENSIGMLLCVKKMQLKKHSLAIIKELSAYHQIGQHQNILTLYQVLIDQGDQVLVKEAYSGLVTSNCDIPQLLKDVLSALRYLESIGIFTEYLQPSDIRQCFGIWKLENLSKCFDGRKQKKQVIPIESNISNLELILVNMSARSSMSPTAKLK